MDADMGQQRKKTREAFERDKAQKFLREKVLQAAEEQEAARRIQATYRGFMSRQFAKRWCRALAEEQAQKAIEHSAAVMMQSTWRRYVAQVVTAETRTEQMEYLNDMKMKEDKELEVPPNAQLPPLAAPPSPLGVPARFARSLCLPGLMDCRPANCPIPADALRLSAAGPRPPGSRLGAFRSHSIDMPVYAHCRTSIGIRTPSPARGATS